MANTDMHYIQALFQAHAHEVNAFIRGKWPREQDVADIVQEAYLRLSQYQAIESIQNPRAFLFQTATNVLVDRHRRRETRERFLVNDAELDQIEDHHASPEQTCVNQEALNLLTTWLAELPDLQQHAFILFRLEGASHAEIAKRLGISVRCSERYVKLALQHISKRLTEQER